MKKTIDLHIRVDPDLMSEIEYQARKKRQTKSDYVRLKIVEGIEKDRYWLEKRTSK